MVCVILRLDWIRRDTQYLSVLSSNAGKYGTRRTSVFEHFSRIVWYTSSSDSFSLMSHFLRVFYKSISSLHFILTTYCNNIWNLTASVIIFLLLPYLIRWIKNGPKYLYFHLPTGTVFAQVLPSAIEFPNTTVVFIDFITRKWSGIQSTSQKTLLSKKFLKKVSFTSFYFILFLQHTQ